MPSTLSVRSIREEDIEQYAMWVSPGSAAAVALPSFQPPSNNQVRHSRNQAVAPRPVQPVRTPRPQLVPSAVPERQGRRAPLLVRANRTMRTALVALCGIAIVGYGFDVATSNTVGQKQEQSRRLNEENSELSAQLLHAISFQGIQDSVVGKFGLHVPEQVTIVKEKAAPAVPTFKADRHQLPIMSGY